MIASPRQTPVEATSEINVCQYRHNKPVLNIEVCKWHAKCDDPLCRKCHVAKKIMEGKE